MICICGHNKVDHRISWAATTGAEIVEECEHPDEDLVSWDQQCLHYKPVRESQ